MTRHLITSAIPYINGIKHLGNLVGSQLPSRLLLFTALVCSGLPRLMKTFRNILDDRDHSD